MNEDTLNYLLDKIGKLESRIDDMECASAMNIISVKRRKLHEDCIYPTQANEDDAGHDLYALEDVELPFGVPVKIKTGLSLQMPKGYYCSIRDRSGLGSKGIHVLGGVADSGYSGEYMAILVNLNKNKTKINIRPNEPLSLLDDLEPYQVKKGDKIAQLVFSEVPQILWSDDEFQETERGEKGFNSSGR